MLASDWKTIVSSHFTSPTDNASGSRFVGREMRLNTSADSLFAIT